MAMMHHFTSTATREGRWWVVQCDQHPGALSQVARLDQAAEYQREAISFVTDLPEDQITVKVIPRIGDDIARTVDQAQRDRAEAERLAQAASENLRRAARELHAQGLSLRDIGVVLGVSFQRAGQLVKDAA
ncbi:MAG: hypothetical protein QM597_06935 [Aeromicrobium sp.]|uniref:hypothetical protein n=1 Tax=Aeromicrobium sp. TaxID=1871063 RepID=UPI0039E42F12